MSALINRVKDHISDNRGKYGAAAGAGAMYGASKIDSPLVNQAGFNILAKGQNLALDAAAKIDPRATSTLNDLGMHKIRPEDIDASNALYNSGVAKYINPNPVDMVNANEHSTEAYNKAMALKANAEDTLVNAKNQGQDYIDQGINYVKGLNPFSENTISIPVKNLLLEGHTPEVIVEAVHANHPSLDKRIITNGGKLYGSGFRKNGSNEHMAYNGGTVSENRAELANSIRETRKLRDEARANMTGNPNMTGESGRVHDNKMYDNLARAKSRFGLSDLGAHGGKIPADILMNSVVKTNPSAQTNLFEFQRKPDSWKLYPHGLISRNISSAKQ